MIILQEIPAGKIFKLDKQDWHGDWHGFLKAIKKLRSVSYSPAEVDDPNAWYCSNVDWPALRECYKKYIGKVLEIVESDKKAGFEPLKRGWRK